MTYTKQQFATRIKTRYPSYSGMDDDELVSKITTKYPEYSSQIAETEVPTNEPISPQIPKQVDIPPVQEQSQLQTANVSAPQDINNESLITPSKINNIKNDLLNKARVAVEDSRKKEYEYKVRYENKLRDIESKTGKKYPNIFSETYLDSVANSVIDTFLRTPEEQREKPETFKGKAGDITGKIIEPIVEFSSIAGAIPKFSKIASISPYIAKMIHNVGMFGAYEAINELAEEDPELKGWVDQMGENAPLLVGLGIAPLAGISMRAKDISLAKKLLGYGRKFTAAGAAAFGTSMLMGNDFNDALVTAVTTGGIATLGGYKQEPLYRLKEPKLKEYFEQGKLPPEMAKGKPVVDVTMKPTTIEVTPVAKPKAIDKPTIVFKNTEEAVKFGEVATKEQVKDLAIKEQFLQSKAEKQIADKDFKDAVDTAVQAQLYREAREAFDSKAVTYKKTSKVIMDDTAPQEQPIKTKIVNKEGKPLEVYHGSENKFDKFDPEKMGKNDSGWLGKAIYFTKDKDIALKFAKGKESNIIKANLEINNPLDLAELTAPQFVDIIQKSRLANNKEPMDEGGIKSAIKDFNEGYLPDNNDKIFFTKKEKFLKDYMDLTKAASDAGYDGVIGLREGAITVINPDQVRFIKPTTLSDTDVPEKKNYSRTKQPFITTEQRKRAAKKIKVKEIQQNIVNAKDAESAVHQMIIDRRSEIDLSSLETNEFIHNIKTVTSKEQRKIIPFLIEGTDVPKELGMVELEKAMEVEKQTKELGKIVEQVKDHFDKGWQFLKDNSDDMSVDQIENYVTHIWDIPKNQRKLITSAFTTHNKFLKKRYIDTLEQGIKELGLTPKVLDITDIIKIHDSMMNKTIANKKLVDKLFKLRKEGVPLIERADKAPIDWIYIDHPALRKKFIVPSNTKFGEKISPDLQDILTELGVAIGRRISPKVFGKPNSKQGSYVYGIEPPEIKLQRFFETRTVAHEIGHHIDISLGLGDKFLNQFKNELLEVNKDRIEKMKDYKAGYAESTEEQIAEFFSMLFTVPEETIKIAPNVSAYALDMLKKDKVLSKLVDLDFENNAKNLIEESTTMLVSMPVKVHPDLAKPLKVIFDSPLDHAVINAIQNVNAVLKKAQLSLSLFHHGALLETSIPTIGLIKTGKLLFNLKDRVWKNMDISKDAVKHGLQLGASNDIPVQKIQGWFNTLELRTKDIPIAKQLTKAIASLNSGWDKVLWEYLHDGLKIYGYEHLVSQLDPTKTVSMTKAKREIAQFINDTYGGQNWDLLMMNPKTIQLMSLALLSPDWTFSTVRQGLSPFGIGSMSKEGKKLRGKLGRGFTGRVILYYGLGISLLSGTIYAYNNKGKFRFMWDNAIGHKTHIFAGYNEDGTERYIRWGKQFRELAELALDPLKKIGGKASPSLQLSTQLFTGRSLSGFTNRDIDGKEGVDKAMGIIKTIAKSLLPFSSRTMLQKDKEFFITDIIYPSSKGMSKYKAVELFKKAIVNSDENAVRDIYRDAAENNLDAYALFKQGLSAVKSDNTMETNKNIKLVSDVREQLKTAKGKEKEVLKRKLSRLLKEERNKKNSNYLLGKAIFELDVYEKENMRGKEEK